MQKGGVQVCDTIRCEKVPYFGVHLVGEKQPECAAPVPHAQRTCTRDYVVAHGLRRLRQDQLLVLPFQHVVQVLRDHSPLLLELVRCITIFNSHYLQLQLHREVRDI